jgi:uncharacterized protein YneF (UPF0154 family)
MKKLIEILFIITCFVVIACGGLYLHKQFIKYVVNQNCGCILQK